MNTYPQPEPGHRDWYAFEAIRQLPRIILMVDKNPFSPTYGCFDREFWHYRTVDFPCGMNQEFCLPLAMAYAHGFPSNPYHKKERMRELAAAAIAYARKSSHADGTCDDYFPFEKALGALVFSTYAMTESYQVLQLECPDALDFFRLRGDWLLNHNETGQLANHQAFAALALYNIYLLTEDKRYLQGSQSFRDLTLSWQHEEGWFQEYEGADPGYHSCSIAFLSKLYLKSKDESLVEPITRAIRFAAHFMHPDGSYAGEYGSRNTYHFYPHGFEVFAVRDDTAKWIAQMYLSKSLPSRTRYFNDDNRMCAHYVYDWMQSWLDWHSRPPTLEGVPAPETGSKWFPDAELYTRRTATAHVVVSMAKGGVYKAFTPQGCVASDTGVIVKSSGGEVLVSHHIAGHRIDVDEAESTLTVSGHFCRRRSARSSPLKQIVFRLLNLTVARVSPNLLRLIIQKLFITGKAQSPCKFRRVIKFEGDRMEVADYIDSNGMKMEAVAIGSDATSIYVANSNVYQDSVLTPWKQLDAAKVNRAKEGEVLLDRREIDLVAPDAAAT